MKITHVPSRLPARAPWGERDVDTVHNHNAHQDVPQEIGQKYFSIGCDELEPLPLPPNALALIQKLATEVASKSNHKAGAK